MAWVAGAMVVGSIASSAMAPSGPDYSGAAQAQGQANTQATRLSTQLNRPNEVTPYGSRTWYQGPQNSSSPATSSWTPYAGGTNPNTGQAYQPVSAGTPQVNTPTVGNRGPTAKTQMQPGPQGSTMPTVGTPQIPSSGSGGGAGQPSYVNNYTQPSGHALSPGSGSTPFGLGGAVSGAINGALSANSASTLYNPQDQWTSVEQLSPVQQQLFDTQNRISQDMGNLGESQLGSVNASLSTPASSIANGLKPLQQGVSQGPVQNSIASGGKIQTGVNTGNVPGVPSNTSQGNQQAYDALMARQNTGFDQQEDALKTQLANQGIAPGSEAYNRAMQPLQQSRVDATNQATINAGALQQQQFDMGLQANQTQFGENLQAGQFANTAQGQQFGQNATNSQFFNSAQAQQFAQGLQGAQFGNQARSQGLSENQTLRELPLNELNSLRSGTQVQAPQFQAYSANANVQPAPLYQAAVAQGQQSNANYNNTMQGLYGLGSAYLAS